MSTDRDVTGIVRSWLEEGATALPDRVLDSVLDQLPATSQRRPWWPARRFREMNNVWKLAIAAAAVVVVAIVGINLLPGRGRCGRPAWPARPRRQRQARHRRSPSPSPASFPDGPLAAGSVYDPAICGARGPVHGAGWLHRSGRGGRLDPCHVHRSGWLDRARRHYRSLRRGLLATRRSGSALHPRRLVVHRSKLCGGSGPDFPGPSIPTGTTVDEFVTALVDHPDLDVTSPVAVTLGGYSGKYLELRAPANTTTDELGPDPSGCNYYFVWEPGIYAQGPNALWRIWVLDVNGVRVVVRADSFPGTTAQIQAQLQAIVDSIQIET